VVVVVVVVVVVAVVGVDEVAGRLGQVDQVTALHRLDPQRLAMAIRQRRPVPTEIEGRRRAEAHGISGVAVALT
jgi:hypothetical protein